MNTNSLNFRRFSSIFALAGLMVLIIGLFSFTSYADSTEPFKQQAEEHASSDESSPYTTSLLEQLELREAQGLPVPTYTVETTYTEEKSNQLRSDSGEPLDVIRKTSVITISYVSPEQAGYETWPALNSIADGFGDESGNDYDQMHLDQVAEEFPIAEESVANGDAPRQVTITEMTEYAYPKDAAEAEQRFLGSISDKLLGSVGTSSISESDVLMGFTYIGPQIWWGIEERIFTRIWYPEFYDCDWWRPWDCKVRWKYYDIEALYIKMGVELAWGLGLRLPAEVDFNRVGTGVLNVGDSESFTTSLTTKNWSDGKGDEEAETGYHDFGIWLEKSRCDRPDADALGTCGMEGHEYVTYLKAFAGVRLRIAGVDICAIITSVYPLGCGIDKEFGGSSDFYTPLGKDAVFDLAELPLTLFSLPKERNPQDCKPKQKSYTTRADAEEEPTPSPTPRPECKDNGEKFEFSADLIFTPQIGGKQIIADMEARANCPSGDAYYQKQEISYLSNDPPNDDGEVTVQGQVRTDNTPGNKNDDNYSYSSDITVDDLCDDTRVTISNFRYLFENFLLDIDIQFNLSVFGFSPQDLGAPDFRLDLFTLNLSSFFRNIQPPLAVGDHMYCTTTLSRGIDCKRRGPGNLVRQVLDVQLCDNPDVTHVIIGEQGEAVSSASVEQKSTRFLGGVFVDIIGGDDSDDTNDQVVYYYRSDVEVELIPTGTSDSCSVDITWEPWWSRNLSAESREEAGVPIDYDPASPLKFTDQGAHEFVYYGDPTEGEDTTSDPVKLVIDKTYPEVEYTEQAVKSTVVSGTEDPTQTIVIDQPIEGYQKTNGWYNRDVKVSFTATDPVMEIQGIPSITSTSGNTAKSSVDGDSSTSDNTTKGWWSDIWGSITDSINNIITSIGNAILNLTQDIIDEVYTTQPDNYQEVYRQPGSGVAFVSPPTILTEDGDNITLEAIARDRAGNETVVTVGPFKIDQTDPTFNVQLEPEPNEYGWINSGVVVGSQDGQDVKAVKVDFNAADETSGIDYVSASSPSTSTDFDSDDDVALIIGEGRNFIATALARDVAGNEVDLTVQDIKIDLQAPEITSTVPEPNEHGWYNSSVTIDFEATDPLLRPVCGEDSDPSCNDAGSGVRTIIGDDVVEQLEQISSTYSLNTSNTISIEGADQSSGVVATDFAGNSANELVTGINIDMTPPVSENSISGTMGNNEWYVSYITLTFTADDPGLEPSGVELIEYSMDGETWELYTEGLEFTDGTYTVYYRASDYADNVEEYNTVNFKIDTIPPTIVGETIPAPNVYGWNNEPVTVEFTATDEGSGVFKLEPVSVYLPDEGADQSATADAEDYAGNTSSLTVEPINIDLTPPELTITSAVSSQYTIADTFIVEWEAFDALSGLATETAYVDGNVMVENGEAIDLLFVTIGWHTLSVEVVDKADNSTSDSVEFEVIATIDSMKIAVERLCEMGYITKQGICNSLMAKLNAAGNAEDRGQEKTAAMILGAFANQLDAQHGKSINDDAYRVLMDAANYVIDHLSQAEEPVVEEPTDGDDTVDNSAPGNSGNTPANNGNSAPGNSGNTPASDGNSAPGNSGNTPAADDGSAPGNSDNTPAVEEPVAEEPAVEEPTVEEPVAEEPAVEEPVAEEPVVEEPVAEEPVVEEPVAEEPVVEEPAVEEPVETAPGNSGNAPGQDENGPGNSENAPGQSGDTAPGNSGNTPAADKSNGKKK